MGEASIFHGEIEELQGVIKQPQFAEGEPTWDYNRAEMVPWVYKSQYHGVEIRVVEYDHRKTEQLPDEIDFPPHWREALETQVMNADGSLFLEYFVPELENTVYKTPVLGAVAREKGEVENVTSFFGYAAKVCGREGKSVFTADPNLSPGTFLLQRANLFLAHGIPNWFKGKDFRQSMEDYYGTPHTKELGGVERTVSVDDARRLQTARAVINVALENQTEGKSVSLITAPVHAEQIDYYVRRQNDFESTKLKVPAKPEELATKCSPIEAWKMKLYSVLMRPVLREYKPLLSKKAYELDMLVGDYGRESFVDRGYQAGIFNEDHLKRIYDAIGVLTVDNSVSNSAEVKYKKRVEEIAKPLVQKMLADLSDGKELDKKELDKLEKTISTHDIGWGKVRNVRIY